MNSSHLTEEKIERYSMGKLAESELALAEEHLLLCVLCQEQVEKMDEFVHAVREAAKLAKDDPPNAWDRFREFFTFHPGSAWAGVSAVAAAVVIFSFLPFSSSTPQHLALSSVRGSESSVPHAKANTPIDLQLDVTDLPASPLYTIELVDSGGGIVRNYTNEPKSSKLNVAIGEKLPSGQYWIRLYGNSLKTDLLREYGLKVD
jgi:hypothetical protein